jgi:hypothetical protein
MPIVGLYIWDDGVNYIPTMNAVEYDFVPRLDDFVELPNLFGGASVYKVFAVVLARTGDEVAADVHVEQVSADRTASVSYLLSQRRIKMESERDDPISSDPPPSKVIDFYKKDIIEYYRKMGRPDLALVLDQHRED